LKAKQIQLSDEKKRIARLQGDLSDIRGKFHASKQERTSRISWRAGWLPHSRR
jgi:hypothetical protein